MTDSGTLFIGTTDGLFSYSPSSEDSPASILDIGTVFTVEQWGASDQVLAGTHDGLYRSLAGKDWSTLGVPDSEVHAVWKSPDREFLFVGTSPPHVYRSGDGGESWTRLDRFATLPDRPDWLWGGQPDAGSEAARVRTFAGTPAKPGRLLAGIESVGVYGTDDYGATWDRRSKGLHGDVHHLCSAGPDTYVAATGRGLYKTTSAGQEWYRLDTAAEPFWFDYFPAAVIHEGTLLAGASDRSMARHRDEERGRAFRSTDGGRTLTSLAHPKDDRTYLTAWFSSGTELYTGTHDGTLLRWDGEWHELVTLPARITAITAVQRGSPPL